MEFNNYIQEAESLAHLVIQEGFPVEGDALKECIYYASTGTELVLGLRYNFTNLLRIEALSFELKQKIKDLLTILNFSDNKANELENI
jgi:hypothetical protein